MNSFKSIQILSSKLIDYAGLFPPASLDLKTAFLNYLTYCDSPFSWMLSKFIIPSKRLPELALLIENGKLTFKKPIPFSILGGSEVGLSKFFDGLSKDITLISEFKSKFGDDVITETYETHLPLELMILPDAHKIIDFFNKITVEFYNKLKVHISVFYEAVPNKDLVHLARAISINNLSNSFAGYKIRTGGIEGSSFPDPGKIAHAIKVCRENDSPFKCTAGLHHPLRHYDRSVQTKMHGFINVFCTGILAYNLDLNEHQLTKILLEEDSNAFKFSDDSISWENFTVFNEEISEAREKFILSFGSCSFDDPINDLKTLNLL